MKSSSAVDKVFVSFKVVGRVAAVAGLFVAALALFAGPAAACCTAVVCPYAVSGSDNCVGGPNMPVCNLAGCNCNTQCGEYAFTTAPSCVFSPTCSSSVAQSRFDEIDANHDGKISLAEMQAWILMQKDWSKNLSRKGFPAKLQAATAKEADLVKYGFGKEDKNHDGSITPAEFDSSLAKPAK